MFRTHRQIWNRLIVYGVDLERVTYQTGMVLDSSEVSCIDPNAYQSLIISTCNIVGSLLAAGILQMRGIRGWSGWQWL